MIEIVFVGPCEYDNSKIGWGDREIAYTGEDPRRTAEAYVRRLGYRHKLLHVRCNGRVWFDGMPKD